MDSAARELKDRRDVLRLLTKEALLSSLREILSEALEFNRAEARQAAENDFTEELVTV